MPVIPRSGATRNLGRGRKSYHVYLLTNRSGTLYTGLTSDLERRVYEHKHKLVDGFTKKYNVGILVYYEATDDIRAAIGREKQIKAWRRSKRIALIESMNPQWQDLSRGMVHFPTTRFLAPLGMTGIGVQMRTKRMSNGGPTMRGRAKLSGA
jgi:putative endonuclease